MKIYEIEIAFKRKLKKSEVEDLVFNMSDIIMKSAKVIDVRMVR